MIPMNPFRLRLPPLDAVQRRQPDTATNATPASDMRRRLNAADDEQVREVDNRMHDIGQALERRRRRAAFLRSLGRFEEADALEGPVRPSTEPPAHSDAMQRRREIVMHRLAELRQA